MRLKFSGWNAQCRSSNNAKGIGTAGATALGIVEDFELVAFMLSRDERVVDRSGSLVRLSLLDRGEIEELIDGGEKVH